MNRTSIHATNVLTADGWMLDQLITIDKGIITAISTSKNTRQTDLSTAYKVDYLIPGMPNVHSHGFQWALSGLAENYSRPEDSFWSWRELMYKFLQRLQPEHLSIIAQALYVEMLKAGYTSVGEFHYLHNDGCGHPYQQIELLSVIMIEAALTAGMSICHLPVLYQQGGIAKKSLAPNQQRFFLSNDHYVAVVENLRQIYQFHPEVNIGIAPHSLRAVAITDLIRINQLLARDLPVHIHIAEQQAEVASCSAHFNRRPVELLYESLEVNENWSLIHATHTDDNEISLIAASGATVGLCITTEANLGDGFFDVEAFSHAAGHWGIGSDSHVSINPIEELRWLEYEQRLRLNRRACYASASQKSTAENLYLDAARNGAKSLGFRQGSMQVGEKADFVCLKVPAQLKSLNPQQIFSKWLFSSRNNWIEAVMVSGQWVIQKGQHPLEDSISNRYGSLMKELLSP